MKKLTCMVLILSILISCVSFVGCTLLSKDIEMLMKEDYVKQFNITDVSAEDVVVDYYVGKYSDYHIVMLDAERHQREPWEENIEGISITYYDSNRLYGWNEDGFSTLSDLYESSKLSLDDISKISKKFSKDVQYFINTCDVFDLPHKSTVYSESAWKEDETYNQVNVWFSRDFRGDLLEMNDETKTIDPVVDYLGKDTVKGIAKIRGLEMFIVVTVELRINSEWFREYAVKKLMQKPGVIQITPIIFGTGLLQ